MAGPGSVLGPAEPGPFPVESDSVGPGSEPVHAVLAPVPVELPVVPVELPTEPEPAPAELPAVDIRRAY